ncbi:hypothetical protein C0989_004777 [Termitomyces sp. Mn162]|nr:hypothetical protein C0989_004777 [Termitomyces sp. Mn162]
MSGIITGPNFKAYFDNPGPIALGTMVAILEVGAFATSVAAGRIGDLIGRRGTLFAGAVVFTIGGAIQTFTTGFWSMIIGRLVSGFGVGLLSTIVPIYQSEISPPNHRGALACMEFTGNIIGYSSSVWTDYFCSFLEKDLSWRIPLWLIDTDKDAEGMQVLADLHGGNLNDPIAVAEFREIKEKVQEERDSGEVRSYHSMWKKYKRRVLLAMSSQAFAQLNGINGYNFLLCPSSLRRHVHFFVEFAEHSIVALEAGWIGRQAILMTGFNSLIYILSTLPPWYLVDRWGRRTILLSGAVIMSAALVATGWWMALDVPRTPNAVVICVIIFNAAFGYSEIRQCTSVSILVSIPHNFNLMSQISTVYPETKGVPLEEMDAIFGEGAYYCGPWKLHCITRSETDEREEQLDNESERTSLVSNSLPTDHQTIRSVPRPSNNSRNRSWFGGLFNRRGGNYDPILAE